MGARQQADDRDPLELAAAAPEGELSAEERRFLRRYTDGVAVVFAGPANVCMQLAHYPVGRGVLESTVHSGSVYRHPFKRYRTTIAYLDIAFYGDAQLRADYREAVNGAHRQVRSTPASPVRYNAFSRDLQLWVASCLYYGFRDAVVRLHGPLSEQEEDLLLRMSARMGTTLQVPAEEWHRDRAAFEAYWADGLARIEMDDEVRAYLLGIVNAEILPTPLKQVFRPVTTFFNTGFLVPEVRAALGLEWSPRQERAMNLLLRTVGILSRPLPAAVRRAPLSLMTLNIRTRRALGRPMV